MNSGNRMLLGAAGAVLLLLVLFAAFAAGVAWTPRDVQDARLGPNSGMGPHRMMGGPSAGAFDEDEPFDRRFIDRMIPHHAMAIRSAQHMISDSPRPEMRELADDIVESQSEQIEQMRAWREEWYGNPGPRYTYPTNRWGDGMGWDDNRMMGQGGGMMGQGGAADAMFLRMMIPHHEQAIRMSREAVDSAEHPEIRHLAEQIIAEQSAEIELMRGFLREIE
jgi:uncharacterized protein (DUF305 family)